MGLHLYYNRKGVLNLIAQFKIKISNSVYHDYTAYVEALSPVRNDLDADGSGRNLLDGKMYRTRIAQKQKWNVKFLPLPELIMKQLAEDMDPEYVNITLLDPKTNTVITKTYYTATLNYGAQRYDRGRDITVYEGCSFDITEQ